jgi:hypothetical protein
MVLATSDPWVTLALDQVFAALNNDVDGYQPANAPLTKPKAKNKTLAIITARRKFIIVLPHFEQLLCQTLPFPCLDPTPRA